MPTFLVTRRMSPALAARVAASVSGRRSGAASKRRPFVALLRLAAVALVAASVFGAVYARRQKERAFEMERESLLQSLRNEASPLTAADRDSSSRVEAIISSQATSPYPGDFIARELRDDSELKRTLGLPTIYVRGLLAGLAHRADIARFASSSTTDAFVLCLNDPPAERTEKILKGKALSAYGRKGAQAVAHVERLHALIQGMPLLGPDWERRVRSAATEAQLHGLRKLFEVSPLKAAVRAAKAKQVLVVIDEPGDGTGPTELDGETQHPIRVILADLTNGEVRLRFRKQVDPNWISPNVRAEYARGIDSCALAMDLRSAIGEAPATQSATAGR